MARVLTDAQRDAAKRRSSAWYANNKERAKVASRENARRRYAELKAEGGEAYKALLDKKAAAIRARVAALPDAEKQALREKEAARWAKRKADPDKIAKILANKREYVVRVRAQDPDQYERIKQHKRNWWKNNKAHGLALVRARQTRLIKACPAWADQEKIKRTYVVASRISEVSGIPHHVDHVIPLRGDTVCGLHVPENLMVVAYDYNCSKSNRYEV